MLQAGAPGWGMAVAASTLSGAVREAVTLLWVLQGQEVMLVYLPEELLAQPKPQQGGCLFHPGLCPVPISGAQLGTLSQSQLLPFQVVIRCPALGDCQLR